MSLLVRAPFIRQNLARSPISAAFRNVHYENTLYNNMPFSYRNKRSFAIKLTLFMVGGFSIPFAAAAYQLRKSSASA